MIKNLPGWLNFFILWAAYFLLTIGVDFFLLKVKYHKRMHWLLDFVITSVYCGGYLAKWRFYDGGWHFQ